MNQFTVFGSDFDQASVSFKMLAYLAVFVLFSAASALDPCDIVGQLKADPKNCDRFYQCTNDGWTSLQCQPPTLFNKKIMNCDWPKNVDCSSSSLGLSLDSCDIVGQLKADPKNCDRFYQCTNDGWTSLQCQPPTLFNKKIMNCDWPKNVDCSSSSLGLTLDSCDIVGQLKADPKNCDRFYQCTNDGWTSLQCQPPTLFNKKIMNCDWPKNVDCSSSGLGLSLDPCDIVGQLKADPKNCNRFYQCTNDGWVSLQCQPPTLFNPKILNCDWPKNVDCTTN